MGQLDYTSECVENALAAAEVGGSRNLAVLAAEVRRLADALDAAHGLICNAHRKRVDDVTEEDGASPGWAKAARRWINAYPFDWLDQGK